MPGDASIGLYFAFYAFIFEHGPLYMAGAATADEHADVEKMMCEDLPSMCPCNAKNLQVNLQVSGAVEGTAMECGDSQTRADMAALPIIKPPTGVTLDQNALYTVMIIDRDPPSRDDPKARYWLHGLYSDITTADMNGGIIANGRILMAYAGPTPPSGTGTHSYQILLLKQSATADDIQGVPSSRAAVDAQHFLHTNKMCDPGQLIGSFEFVSSEPDGLDVMNADRPCPKP